MDDNRFFASATAPVAAGRAAVRVVLVELTLAVLAWLGALAAVGFAEVGDVALEVAGFLAVVVVEDVAVFGLGEAADEEVDSVEVRLAAVLLKAEGRRFSSSEAEAVDLCAVEEPTVDVRLVAVELAVGRVGGLVKPPLVLVRVPEDAVGFVALEEVVAGRRVVVVELVDVGFLAAVEEVADLAPAVPVAGFFTGAATGDGVFSAGASAAGASA